MLDLRGLATMLLHMPWWHYLLMAGVVMALGIAMHTRIRRTYVPRHTTISMEADRIEHMVILIVFELMALGVIIILVVSGMYVYHLLT